MDDPQPAKPPLATARTGSDLLAFSAEQLDDPYATFDRLREHHPVVWHSGIEMWLVSRYRDCAILGDRRFGKEYARARVASPCEEPIPESLRSLVDMRDRWFLRRDPPDHTRLKNLTRQALSSDAVAALRASIQERVDALIDGAGDRDTMDVIADLAAPLSIGVMTHMLGAPEIDNDLLSRWSQELTGAAEPYAVVGGREHASELTRDLLAQLRDIARARSRHPGDDSLLDHLLDARRRGLLDDDELLATCTLILFGGIRTTTDLIGNTALALLQHPQHLRRLQQDLSLVPAAVDEALRYDPPLQMCTRVATEDVALGDQRIRAGDWVGVLLGSGCHDPRHFAHPDVFSLDRTEHSLLPFGRGYHFCPGMALARAEATHAIGTLVRRIPGLELGGCPVRRPAFVFRGLAELPVAVRGRIPAEQAAP